MSDHPYDGDDEAGRYCSGCVSPVKDDCDGCCLLVVIVAAVILAAVM